MADNAQSILRRLRDISDNPRLYLEMLTDRLANFNKGRVAEIRPEGAGYRKLTPKERTEQMVGGALENIGGGGLGALGIIKGKGGNWLTGSVEEALKGLKKRLPGEARDAYGNIVPAVIQPHPADIALNRWIEGPLTKYVKRDMATEGDPVRRLAEQGILHTAIEPSRGYRNEVVKNLRIDLGGKQAGISDLAKGWEDVADASIDYGRAGGLSQFHPEQEWLRKVDPHSVVFEPRQGEYMRSGDLGFSHLTDELANALNPESGLPRNLLLTPEQMQQMGMEKAVRHVAEINAWRESQKAEADLARAQNPATVLFKEYAENNPKGLRWVELKAPEGTNPAYLGQGKYEDEAANVLADALKYEGDVMGHCVGGYCPDVMEGRSRIFSLRDAKGQPHVTIETRPHKRWNTDVIPNIEENLGERIVQIKGKANLAPKEEYLPFVRDFVKSGKWGDVGDLRNAGLRKTSDALNRMEIEKLKSLGVEDIPDYVTGTDLQGFADMLGSKLKYDDMGNIVGDGYAEGGLVNKPAWRPMELGGIMTFVNE